MESEHEIKHVFDGLGESGNILRYRTEVPTDGVEFIEQDIDYEEFFCEFMLPNKPCVLGRWMTDHWPSVKEWAESEGGPNFDKLDRKFGHALVPVANCGKVQYQAQPKQDMKLSAYLGYWKDYISADHSSSQGCLYLKDWHFTQSFPDYKAYSTPIFFSSDWLNEFWDHRPDSCNDDFRFVYMGPKDSWTPFHADVFRSYSWSANICGRKRWLMLPPGEEDNYRDQLGNLAYDLTSPDIEDTKKFPHRHKAREPFEVIQEAGQVIFVPSGWHHQVFNLEDTISINHNWLNGCNIDISWQFLQNELRLVERSIEDCRSMDGWDAQCQLIMKASTGMDYAEFYNFLQAIASKRLQLLSENSPPPITHNDNKTDQETPMCMSKNSAEQQLKKQVKEDAICGKSCIGEEESCEIEASVIQTGCLPCAWDMSSPHKEESNSSKSVSVKHDSELGSSDPTSTFEQTERVVLLSHSNLSRSSCTGSDTSAAVAVCSGDPMKPNTVVPSSHSNVCSRRDTDALPTGAAHGGDNAATNENSKLNQSKSTLCINNDNILSAEISSGAESDGDSNGRASCKVAVDGSDVSDRVIDTICVHDRRHFILTDSDGRRLSRNHWIFDLRRIQHVLHEMMKNKEFLGLDFALLSQNPCELTEQITAVLENQFVCDDTCMKT